MSRARNLSSGTANKISQRSLGLVLRAFPCFYVVIATCSSSYLEVLNANPMISDPNPVCGYSLLYPRGLATPSPEKSSRMITIV
jgi:hypothetical protein